VYAGELESNGIRCGTCYLMAMGSSLRFFDFAVLYLSFTLSLDA
jgi:hypothetical protein